MPIRIYSKDYYQIITQSSTPIVIEFFATWCPKCMMMEEVYNRIAMDLKDHLSFYKIDVETARALTLELGIEIYPTFIVYHEGSIIGYTSGTLSEQLLRKRILELVSFTKRGNH